MTTEEKIKAAFKQIEEKLHQKDSKYMGREIYYVGKYCLQLFNRLPPALPSIKSPYFMSFSAVFFYLLQKARFEYAEQVYHSGFRNMTPRQVVFHYFKTFQKNQNPEKPVTKFDLTVKMDQMISFLAQVGYEANVRESTFRYPGFRSLDRLAKSNWVKLLNRFLDCKNSADCYRLWEEIVYTTNKSAIDMESIKNDVIASVGFRKWLLKRQVLGIYTIILADYFTHDFFFQMTGMQDVHALEKITKWVGQTYLNYVTLLCYSIESCALSALQSLQKINGIRLWHGDILDNLVGQIEKIPNRYSDIKVFFESFMGEETDFHWVEKIRNHFEIGIEKYLEKMKTENMSMDRLIDWLEGAVDFLKKENQTFLKGTMLESKIKAIESSISKQGVNSPWEKCREKLNSGRLKVLAASIENKYSTESSYFFTIPSVKLDCEQPIPTELCILKKWGSTAGIFEWDKRFHANYGGGYFLYHNGFGLAIDPGPDFIKNLTQYTDYDLLDINGAAVTHIHYDHFGDFKRIVLGVREYNLHVGRKRLFYLFPDKDDQMVHPEKLREDFCINVFEESEREVSAPGEPGCYYLPNNEWGRENGFCIQPLEVVHTIYKGRSRSYGLLVKPLKNGVPMTKILFSGDAEYEKRLFEKIDPEVIILNLSSVRLGDISKLALPKSKDNNGYPILNEWFKKNQLGYSGTLSLMRRLQGYKLAVVGDFFEAQSEGDVRLLIKKALEQDGFIHNSTKKILAGEIGMRVRWNAQNELQVYCSPLCGDNIGFIPYNEKSGLNQLRKGVFSKSETIESSCNACKKIKKI